MSEKSRNATSVDGKQSFPERLNCLCCGSRRYSSQASVKIKIAKTSPESNQEHADINKNNTPTNANIDSDASQSSNLNASNHDKTVTSAQQIEGVSQTGISEKFPRPTRKPAYSRNSESRNSRWSQRRRKVAPNTVPENTNANSIEYQPSKLPYNIGSTDGYNNGSIKKIPMEIEDDRSSKRYMENNKDRRYKPIISDVPMYQHYSEESEQTERERFRDRLQESLLRNLKRMTDASGQQTFPNDADVQSPSANKLPPDDDSSEKDTRKSENVNFNVLYSSGRWQSGIAPTSKDGAMRSVAQQLAGSGPGRARWGEMPEVVMRNLTTGLNSTQRSLMEARFEILTSEASYYKSLTVLIDLFYKSPVFDPNSPNSVITESDKHQLFSNILDIHVTSENLLHSLESNFREDPRMEGFCWILYEHAENKLSCYIPYLKNQMYQLSTLAALLKKPAFASAVKNIQSMPICNGLDLNSFLVMPMQRAMRLRLLVDSVIRFTPKYSKVYTTSLVALASLEKLIGECNAQKGQMERKERLITLTHQLELNSSTPAIAMADRELIKEGNLRILPNTIDFAPTHRLLASDSVKIEPIQATLFLFTDILLITKPKGDKFHVEEVCSRDKLTVSVKYTPKDAVIKRSEFKTKVNVEDPLHVVPIIKLTREIIQSRSQETSPTDITINRDNSLSRSFKNRKNNIFRSSDTSQVNETQKTSATLFTFILTFPSMNGGMVDYHLMADKLEIRERWIDALNPGYYSVPTEVSYNSWDCPQMIVISGHGAKESDQVDVKEGDLINVIVELSDGWIKGILPDGRSGWLPKQNCSEVENANERRQNMKNFLLAEEAQRAYTAQKSLENKKLATSTFT